MTAREQSDAVALAVDGETIHSWPHMPRRRPVPANPFENAVFVKNAIASGSIVPPSGEGANVRRSDIITGVCVLCFIALGVGAFTLAMVWRH